MAKQMDSEVEVREALGNKTPIDDKNANDGAGAKSRKGSLKKRLFFLALFLAVIVGLVYVYWFFNLRGFISTDDAFIDGDHVSLGSKMLGRITSLAVDEGDRVSKGQLLVQLDDSDLQAQKTQAEANLDLARQSVALSKVNLQKAQDDYSRGTNQFKGQIITQENYDHITKALDMARAQYGIELARVKTADAQLGVIQTQIQNTHIAAPFSGVVAKKWALVGDVVQPSQPILTINDNTNIWITANFEETKLASIHPGDPVQISVDAYGDANFEGEVTLIGASAAAEFSLIPPNNASGNFTKVTQRVPVKISIRPASNQQGDPPLLLPGMSVEVKVKTGR
jgi:membrane fusion protein (multidrug efflux system)